MVYKRLVKGNTMKMNAVKETLCAGFVSAEINSEHGKFEIVYDAFSDGTIREIKAVRFEFLGDTYSASEVFTDANSPYDIRQGLRDIVNGRYLIEYGWECGKELCELAELAQIIGTAINYIGMKLELLV